VTLISNEASVGGSDISLGHHRQPGGVRSGRSPHLHADAGFTAAEIIAVHRELSIIDAG
jgi:hypothetical protein